MSNEVFAFSSSSAAYEGMKKEQQGGVRRVAIWIITSMLGLSSLAAVIGIVLVFVFKVPLTGEGLGEQLIISRFGGNQEAVYYKSGTTEAQARRLAGYLRNAGYFTGEGPSKDVVLSRDGDAFVVSLILKKSWDDAAAIDSATQMRAEMAAQVFDGAAVEIHLCDPLYRTQGVLGVRRVIK